MNKRSRPKAARVSSNAYPEIIIEVDKMYVYRQTEPGLYTVGYYDPQGKWNSESDHESRNEAIVRVNYLNGLNANITMEELIYEPDLVALRDDFAGRAMAAFISNSALKEGVSIVDEAYRVADAMIKAREEA